MRRVSRTSRHGLGLFVLLALLAASVLLHLAVGARTLHPAVVLDALFGTGTDGFARAIVWNVRLPRVLTALSVGAGLSVAGALVQGVTRNPLAEPGLLGLVAGATFAVVAGVGAFGLVEPAAIPPTAALGALGGAGLVLLALSGLPGGATPVAMTLAGAMVAAFLGALSSLVFLLDETAFDALRFWLSGSLAGRDLGQLAATAPVLLAALAAALALSPGLTILSSGEDIARGLGIRTGRLKLQLLLCVVALTGCSVALAGPLGFVGLVVPHAVRLLAGADYRWIVPYSALGGGVYLVLADIVAQTALRPQDLSTGIVTALLGAPVFIHLVRRRAR